MNLIVSIFSLALYYLYIPSCDAFSSHRLMNHRIHQRRSSSLVNNPVDSSVFPNGPTLYPSSNTALFMASENEKKPGTINEGISSRLLAETIAPWRSLRLFLYFSLGTGAFVGGLITVTRVLAASRFQTGEVDLNPEYMNLLIDFGAALAFAIVGKIDSDKGAELNARVEQRMEQKKENKKLVKGMKEREKRLRLLELNVRISDDGTVQRAPVEALQKGGKQHMIIVAGNPKVIRDALLGANILKMEFAMRDVLVVPYELDKKKDEEQIRPDGTGFGGAASKPTWENQPYIARTVGDGWENWIQSELADAVKQNGEKAVNEGIAIVVANSGRIIRRGLGKVPWRDMVEELEKTVKEESTPDFGFLSG